MIVAVDTNVLLDILIPESGYLESSLNCLKFTALANPGGMRRRNDQKTLILPEHPPRLVLRQAIRIKNPLSR